MIIFSLKFNCKQQVALSIKQQALKQTAVPYLKSI